MPSQASPTSPILSIPQINATSGTVWYIENNIYFISYYKYRHQYHPHCATTATPAVPASLKSTTSSSRSHGASAPCANQIHSYRVELLSVLRARGWGRRFMGDWSRWDGGGLELGKGVTKFGFFGFDYLLFISFICLLIWLVGWLVGFYLA